MLTKTQTMDAIQKSLIAYKTNVLDNLYANQNAFSNVKVGNTTIAADSITDTLTLTAGNNITLTPNATNDSITVIAKDTTYTTSSPISLSGTTISHATSGASAGSYGDSANQTPGYGATFKVPYLTVNNTGHVTSISEHTVKIPASNNTDTKMNVTLGTTTKAYLVGVSTTPTATAKALTGIADTGVYLDTAAGSLTATTFNGALSGNATSANKVNNQLNIVLKAIQGGASTLYDGSSAQTVLINPSNIGAASENHTHNYAAAPAPGGAATAAIKLNDSRKIGYADFNGTQNVPLNSIFGEIVTTGSASTNKNKWTKIASVDVSGTTPYKTCTGNFLINSAEIYNCSGILFFYFRLEDGLKKTSIALKWIALDGREYANSVAAVKTADGKYDIYFKPLQDWCTVHVATYTRTPEYLKLYSSQSYVASITPEATSSYDNTSTSAAKVNNSLTIQTNGTTVASFDGSAAKTVNITASSIGAAATNHTHSGYAPASHTHNYAGSSSAGGVATQAAKTTGTLTIQTNGTSAGTFNGSANKTINITPANIGAAASNHTHNNYATNSVVFTIQNNVEALQTDVSTLKTQMGDVENILKEINGE